MCTCFSNNFGNSQLQLERSTRSNAFDSTLQLNALTSHHINIHLFCDNPTHITMKIQTQNFVVGLATNLVQLI